MGRSYYGLAWSADSRSLFYIVTNAAYKYTINVYPTNGIGSTNADGTYNVSGPTIASITGTTITHDERLAGAVGANCWRRQHNRRSLPYWVAIRIAG